MEAATESSGHNPSNAGEDGLFEFARGLPGKTRLPPQAYAEKRKGGSTENFKGTVFHLPEKRETTLIRNREKARIVFLRQPTIHSVEQEMFWIEIYNGFSFLKTRKEEARIFLFYDRTFFF